MIGVLRTFPSPFVGLASRVDWYAVDYVTVLTALGEDGEKAIRGAATLTAMVNHSPTSLHVDSYARLVVDQWRERQVAPGWWVAT